MKVPRWLWWAHGFISLSWASFFTYEIFARTTWRLPELLPEGGPDAIDFHLFQLGRVESGFMLLGYGLAALWFCTTPSTKLKLATDAPRQNRLLRRRKLRKRGLNDKRRRHRIERRRQEKSAKTRAGNRWARPIFHSSYKIRHLSD